MVSLSGGPKAVNGGLHHAALGCHTSGIWWHHWETMLLKSKLWATATEGSLLEWSLSPKKWWGRVPHTFTPTQLSGPPHPAVCSLHLRHWQCSKGDFLWLLCSSQLLGKRKILSTTQTILIWRTRYNFRRRNIRWVRGGPAEQMSWVCFPPDGTLKALQIQGYNLSLFFKEKLQVNSYSFWFCFKSLLLV